jgi:nucleoside-diphosphate-sugar epimerase
MPFCVSRQTLFLAGWGLSARAIAKHFTDHNWQIMASTRRQAAADELIDLGFEPVLADPKTAEGRTSLQTVMAKADAVLACAPPFEGQDPFVPVMQDLEISHHWIGYLSTTGVYGDRKGDWVDETAIPAPENQRSMDRLTAERDWLGLDAVVFRLPGIYGPGRSAFDRLNRRDPVFDKPGQVFSRVHVEDIARAVFCAATQPDIKGIFNICDDTPTSQVEVMIGAAEMMGVDPPEIRPFDPDQLTPMQRSFFASCRRVLNTRAKEELNWRPKYPSWREGLRAILNARSSMRENQAMQNQ